MFVQGTNSTSGSEDEASPHACRHCQTEISSLADLLGHRKDCNAKFGICDETSDPEDLVVSGDEDDICSDGEKRQEAVRRQRQDAENNNSVEGDDDGETDNDLSNGFPFPTPGAPGHVTLEALQNTKVAVAQFAATALATNGDNPAALQELAVLQSTLFTLQHQQMMQLSLIQQLQNHLTVHPKEDGTRTPPPASNASPIPGIPLPAALPAQQVSNKSLRIPTPGKPDHSPSSPPTTQSIPPSHKTHHLQQQPLTIPKPPVSLNSPIPPSMPPPAHPPLCSISSSLASTIITNNDPPPSLNEPNTLEMLQKRAQEVLDNASQGLLANNLADELAFRKNGKNSLSPLSGGRNEPFFKHRCRYCGKVFGSDSALQIHIRSHTGERPFKCNVCGSRFTTKGNLKVHFQRHTSKFPHIKMNPNPVPEHLDKFHPPLLAQMGNQSLPPGMTHHNHPHSHRPSPHHPFPGSSSFPPSGLTLFRPPLPHDIIPRPPSLLTPLRHHEPSLLKPLLPLSIFAPRDQQDIPENLSKPPNQSALSPSEAHERYKDRSRSNSPVLTKQENAEDGFKDSIREELLRNRIESVQKNREERHIRRISEDKFRNEEEKHEPEVAEQEYEESKSNSQSGANQSVKQNNKEKGGREGRRATSLTRSGAEGNPDDEGEDAENRQDSGLRTREERERRDGREEEEEEEEEVEEEDDDLNDEDEELHRESEMEEASRARDELEDEREERLSLKPNVETNCIRDQSLETSNEQKLDIRQERGVYSPSPQCDECSVDSKFSDDDLIEERPRTRNSVLEKSEDRSQDQPENLSSKCTTSDSLGQKLNTALPFSNISPHSSNSSGSAQYQIPHGTGSHSQEIDPAKDPAIYNSLLPRPGSNDNSWESLIEVTKTSETYKLQQLVDNIEHKLTDPNQCVICHRVLSCKSALQMHYRTHTGERPFRCKICGRAFTTKGNLKTHMGVHRLKPPMRVLHQCPVCHKKFTNSLVLQQHIRLHTGEPTDLTPEQIHAAEIKDYPHSSPFPHPNFMAHGFPIPGLSSPGLHLGMRSDLDRDMEFKDEPQDDDLYDEDDDDFSNSSESQHQHFPAFSSSISAMENQVRTITTMASQLSASELNRPAEDLTVNKSLSTCQMNGTRSPGSAGLASPNGSDCRVSPSPPRPETPLNIPRPTSSHPPSSPANSESNSLGALDLTPRSSSLGPSPGPPPGIFSGLGLIQSGGPSPLMTSALSSLTSSVLTSTAFSPLGMAVGPAVRGNTTCNICFKTFACNSALEIHYRSHTKERPFKCSICDRGFSTKVDYQRNGCIHQWRIQESKNDDHEERKGLATFFDSHRPLGLPFSGYATDWMHQGNMKQHMLTHKIRDMPPHLFENKKSPSFSAPPPMQSEEVSDVSNMSNSNSTTDDVRQMIPPRVDLPESPVKMDSSTPPPIKRSPSEGDLPVPKRQSSMPKHLCHVCNKNFSSSSALQIHMRTHTGDKPFRCTVCQKAFTTKGNLKVHMGTHMWSNGASRRGRRMSLDLPPIPMNPKDSEFLQRRPDLFYPYLPTPFLNGVQQKLNEMSLMQSGSMHPGNGLHQSGNKFGNILGFGGFNGPDKPLRPDSRSPPPEKQLSSPPLALSMSSHRGSPPSSESIVGDEMPRGVWDLHFDRKSNHSEEHINISPSPGRHLPPSSQRGEGLAA